ncbi:hypothetical protein Plo01_77600 [Planobispora longispora]|uniref:Uncharacterized protein n=1 Tax=Planobispora longispora TaxID=28887 RepID=A0A8J3WB07_9ACTN|nr:hypothetical protein Plo01_77600 [Planobispora longispora]
MTVRSPSFQVPAAAAVMVSEVMIGFFHAADGRGAWMIFLAIGGTGRYTAEEGADRGRRAEVTKRLS